MTLLWLGVAGWGLFEIGLAARTREGLVARLRIIPLTATVIAGIWLGVIAARSSSDLALPGPGWWPVGLGLGIEIAGLSLRAWAVHELGRFFRFTVVVQADHRVVDTGPYSRIRHPSYTGLLMVVLGFGVALGSWLSIPACLLPPLVAFAIRLITEERVLARELGEPYRAYMARTHRLVPGVW
jgi:protein-S-isoprenylcysteine O-methyltransferase Ste14